MRFGCALGAGSLRTSCAQRALGVRAAHALELRSSAQRALSERRIARFALKCALLRSASAERALSERSASAQAALGVRKLSARFALRAVPQPSDRRAICERKTCDFCAAAAPARVRARSGRRACRLQCEGQAQGGKQTSARGDRSSIVTEPQSQSLLLCCVTEPSPETRGATPRPETAGGRRV